MTLSLDSAYNDGVADGLPSKVSDDFEVIKGGMARNSITARVTEPVKIYASQGAWASIDVKDGRPQDYVEVGPNAGVLRDSGDTRVNVG